MGEEEARGLYRTLRCFFGLPFVGMVMVEVDPVGLASDVDLLSKMSEALRLPAWNRTSSDHLICHKFRSPWQENERLKREMIALKDR